MIVYILSRDYYGVSDETHFHGFANQAEAEAVFAATVWKQMTDEGYEIPERDEFINRPHIDVLMDYRDIACELNMVYHLVPVLISDVETPKADTVYVASNRLMEFGVYRPESLDKAKEACKQDMRAALYEKDLTVEEIDSRLKSVYWIESRRGVLSYVLTYHHEILETYAIAPFEVK